MPIKTPVVDKNFYFIYTLSGFKLGSDSLRVNTKSEGISFKSLIKVMDSKKIYLTQEGLDELQKEHLELSKVKRPHVVERLSEARNQGDLSENAEYVAAREELAFIDGRIDELEELLKEVSIIKNTTGQGAADSVKLGSEVTVSIAGKKEVYRVVGEWEADPVEKKISHESPLGKALIGKKIGEVVEVTAPAGKILYTIVSVQ